MADELAIRRRIDSGPFDVTSHSLGALIVGALVLGVGRHSRKERLGIVALDQPFAVDLEEARADVPHETAVVRDEDAACAVLEDFRLELLLAGDVDVVGRLVHQVEVRLGQPQRQQPEAGPLSETQLADRSRLLLDDEASRGQEAPHAHCILLDASNRRVYVADLGLDRFALLGMSQGGPAAIRYAVKYPEKVTHLILYGSYARGRLRRDDAEFGPEMLNAMCTLILQGWGSENESYREFFSSRYVASSNRDHIRWLNELEAISATPEMAARYFRALADIDVRPLLPKVVVPTLVLHCRGDRATPMQFGRELAAGIAGARFVPMEGDNHVFLEHDPASRTFFLEVSRLLGDKRSLASRLALGRRVRNWRALVSHVHHTIEPYYVIGAVASLAVGAVSYVVSRLS